MGEQIVQATKGLLLLSLHLACQRENDFALSSSLVEGDGNFRQRLLDVFQTAGSITHKVEDITLA